MQITPLHTHAVLRIPALTGLFSDSLGISSIDVVADGTTTITTDAAHGVTVSSSIAVSITDAPYPNPITAAVKQSNGDYLITTTNDHDLTTTPNPEISAAWNTIATLRGFTDSNMNGSLQLVSVSDRRNFTVRPSAPVESVTLNGSEEQLVNLEFELVGWHKVTAASATTLTFPTPEFVVRSYTADQITAALNHRIYGLESGELVMRKYVLDDTALNANELVMFVTPRDSVRFRSSLLGDHYAESAYHPTVEDGFDIIVVFPASASSAGVSPVDLAHGEILRAIMKTFNGLNLPLATSYPCAKARDAEIISHGRVSHDGSRYVHIYNFGVNVELTKDDRIQPHEVADIVNATSDNVWPNGFPAYRDLSVTGISSLGEPGLFTINLQADTA